METGGKLEVVRQVREQAARGRADEPAVMHDTVGHAQSAPMGAGAESNCDKDGALLHIGCFVRTDESVNKHVVSARVIFF